MIYKLNDISNKKKSQENTNGITKRSGCPVHAIGYMLQDNWDFAVKKFQQTTFTTRKFLRNNGKFIYEINIYIYIIFIYNIQRFLYRVII